MNDQNESRNSSNFYVFLFGAIMLTGLLFLAWIGSPPTVNAVGEPLPELDLQPLVEAERPLTAVELQGKLVALLFWNVTSLPSQEAYRGFVKLAAEYEESSEILFVSVASSAGPDYDLDALRTQVIHTNDDMNMSVPTYADSAGMTRSNVGLLLPGGTFSYPTTLLIDRKGLIIGVETGDTADGLQALSQQIQQQL